MSIKTLTIDTPCMEFVYRLFMQIINNISVNNLYLQEVRYIKNIFYLLVKYMLYVS